MLNNNFKYFLGLDLSLASTGYAVVALDDDPICNIQVVEVGHIDTTKFKSTSVKLHHIQKKLISITEKFQLEKTIAKEKQFYRNFKTTESLFKVHGAVEAALYTYDFVDYANNTVKKQISGDGHCSKQHLATCVKSLLMLPSSFQFCTDDESDALAIVLTHFLKKQIIPLSSLVHIN